MASHPLSHRAWGYPIGGVLLLLAACAPTAAPASPTAAPAKPAEQKPAAAAQQQPSPPAAKPQPSPGAAQKPAASPAAAAGESIDDLYAKAKLEGGTLSFYGTLAQLNAEKILPEFEKRFPGIKIEHIDATSDKLAARIIAEARGGKTLADVFQAGIEEITNLRQQDVLLDWVPPEAAAYPADMKGSYWLASDSIFIIAAWNTNLVKKEEEPKSFEDFADPKWKGRLIAEPRDYELLMGLATQKYKDDAKAKDLMTRIAANAPEFHKGHSALAELLVAGQAAVCLTCYSHHYPPRIEKGAPVNYMLTEGIGLLVGTSVLKDAPHPNTAKLFARWVASEEGQKVYAQGGRTPVHPNVQPLKKTRPDKIYALTPEALEGREKYVEMWKEIFQLR